MKYKDTLFRTIFKEPKQAIMLYNVISGNNYDPNTPIEINALDEMMFTDKENDVSFVIEDKLVIFIEHQSTINYNMPLRFVEYLSANYRFISGKQKYGKLMIKLPKPEFYVLYNGRERWNTEYLKLSDAFEVSGNADTYAELVAKVVRNSKKITCTFLLVFLPLCFVTSHVCGPLTGVSPSASSALPNDKNPAHKCTTYFFTVPKYKARHQCH